MKVNNAPALAFAAAVLSSSSSSTVSGFNSAAYTSPISQNRIINKHFSTAEAQATTSLTDDEILAELEKAAEEVATDSFDENCLVDPDTGGPVDEICVDESLYARTKGRFKSVIRGTLGLVRSGGTSDESTDGDNVDADDYLIGTGVFDGDVPEGELLEIGWETRGNSSALRRNAEVWKFALKCVFRALKPRKLAKAGASDEEVSAARIDAATFIRDGLLRLGPTFVKLGQVVSTRTDVLPSE